MSKIGYWIGGAIYRIEQAMWHHFGILVGEYKEQWHKKLQWYREYYEINR